MPEKSGDARKARRRSEARAARAHAAHREQDDTVKRRLAWEKRRRRRFTSYGLMVLAVVIASSHLLEHLGVIELLPNPALQDLLIGYPTAGVLLVIGLAMLPAERY